MYTGVLEPEETWLESAAVSPLWLARPRAPRRTRPHSSARSRCSPTLPGAGSHYTKQSLRYCTSSGSTNYGSLSLAQQACTASSSCYGVYSSGCPSSSNNWELCTSASTSSSGSSCIYMCNGKCSSSGAHKTGATRPLSNSYGTQCAQAHVHLRTRAPWRHPGATRS